jgi:hypothetical protein
MRAARFALTTSVATIGAIAAATAVSVAATTPPSSGGAGLVQGTTTSSTATATSAATTQTSETVDSSTTTSIAAPMGFSGGAPLPAQQQQQQQQQTTTTTTTTTSAVTQTSSLTPPFVLSGGASIDDTQPASGVYSISWTCDSGCGVAVHSSPTTTSRVVGRIAEGDGVTVLCQTLGPTVRSGGVSSSVWDRLRDGDWVANVYVATPTQSGLTPGVPSCLLPKLG